MHELIFESIKATAVGALFIYLLKLILDRGLFVQRSWRYIIVGIGFIFFGTLVDISNNIESLGKFILLGDTVYSHFIENVVCYIFGSALLIIGLGLQLKITQSLAGTEKLFVDNDVKLRQTVENKTKAILASNEELRAQIEEKRIAEEALKKNRNLLESINRIQLQFIGNAKNIRTLFDALLNDMLTLTESEFGMIGEVIDRPDGTSGIKMQAVTNIPWNKEVRELYDKYSDSGLLLEDQESLIMKVVKTGRAVVMDPESMRSMKKRQPKGHLAINSFLGLPLRYGDSIVGVVCIANKKEAYTDELVEFLKPFISTCANILEIFRSDRKQKELDQNLRLFTAAIEGAMDAIIIADLSGKIIYNNQSMEELAGYGADELKRMKFDELNSDAAIDTQEMIASVKKNGRLAVEMSIRRKDSLVVPVSITISLVSGTDRQPVALAVIARDITEKKKAEEEKSRYEAFLKGIGDGISIHDRDFKVIYQNEMQRGIFGDRIGEVCYRAYHGRDSICDNCNLAMVFEDGKVRKRRQKANKPGGGASYFDITASPLYDSKGNIYAGIELVRDVTSQALAEEEMIRANEMLRESEERFRTLVEKANDGIAIYTSDGGLLFCNSKASEIMGYSVQELLNMKLSDYAHPEELSMLHERITRRINGLEVPDNYATRVIRKDGSVISVDVSGARTIWNGETVDIVVIRDVTSRKIAELEKTRADERLSESEQNLKDAQEYLMALIDGVAEPIMVIGLDYKIMVMNKTARNFLGRDLAPNEEIFCHALSHRLDRPCSDSDGHPCPLDIVKKTFKPVTIMHKHFDLKGEERLVEIMASPLFGKDGELTAVIESSRDITERKTLEDQLRHSQKLEAVGTLAGGVAHEFNNILTAIIGCGTLSQMRLEKNHPARMYIDQILASSKRAAGLTKSLLAFSRKQISNPRLTNLNDILKLVEKLLHRLIGEDVTLKTILSEEPLPMVVDSGQIEQILMNLMTNARDAMPSGGSIIISTETEEMGKEFLTKHGFGIPGRYALMTVSDTGTGMDEATRDKIFEPFFTTKGIGKGTGLGLSIVYGIVKQQQGFITVESALGKGTAFRIYLPLKEAETAETVEPTTAQARGGSETILVAEDDADVRNLTKDILGSFGYNVILAVDGADAVKKFKQDSDKIDLLLLDVVMPKKGGKEAYDEIRKIRPDIDVLFISGYAGDNLVRAKVVDQGLDLLQKPLSPEDLLKHVRTALDNRIKRKKKPDEV